MNDQICEHGAAIIRAARTNDWEPSLRAHFDSCAVCREAVKVARAMASLIEAESVDIPSAPDPQRIWLKAAFAERQKRQTRVARFVGVAYALLVDALGFGVYWGMKSGFSGGLASLPNVPLSTPSVVPLLVILGVVVLILLFSAPVHKRSR